MFGKLKFRVLTQYTDVAVASVASVLRQKGFKIYDLKESSIISDSDGSKQDDVYILCCEGKKSEYEKFREENQYDEIMYEGFKTLM